MKLSRLVPVVVGFTLGMAHVAAAELRPGDDTVYPNPPALFDGTEVLDATAIVSDGVTYPGPRRAYLKALPAPAAAGSDDTTYPSADRTPGIAAPHATAKRG